MRSLKMTTRCHSVFSLRSPLARSFQLSLVASARFTILLPSCVERISGSLPRLPTRITLLTLPAILSIPHQLRHPAYHRNVHYRLTCGQPADQSYSVWAFPYLAPLAI